MSLKRFFVSLGIVIAFFVMSLIGIGLWVSAGSGQDPLASIPKELDPTPYRIYEAVVPDSPLRLKHFVSEANEINVSCSMIMGNEELVLIATPATKLSAERLADEIEATKLKLTYVYLGHAHLDHSQGASVIKERFPDAKFVAEPKVSALQQLRMASDDDRAVARFGSNAAVPSVPFVPLDKDTLTIEGREIQLWHDQYGDVGIGHANEPHTVVYVPDLKALMPNDIAYFGGHMMMGGSTAESRAIWKQQLRDYKKMGLQVVIPGHVPRSWTSEMTPEGVLDHSLSYIEAYEDALENNETSDGVIEDMLQRYPDLEHTSALYLGTYINFKETHRLLFNPRLEKVAGVFPQSFVRWADRRMFETKQKAANNIH